MILSEFHKQTLMKAVLQAGALIAEYAASRKIGDITNKDDGTPVTVVDRLAEDIIVKALNALDSPYPIIGEERFSSGECERLKERDSFWLIDALDGTKEFIAGTGQYTVNIALIYKGRPFWGAIYAPETGQLFEGLKGQGSFLCEVQAHQHIKRIGRCQVRAPSNQLTLVTGSPKRTYTLNNLYDDYVIETRIRTGSSIKFCMIAGGKADIYPRMGPTSEWDTAAADIILTEAGGLIIDLEENRPLSYGHERRNFLNPYFVALSKELYDGNPAFFGQMKDYYLELRRQQKT
jgi:3'(2'), 5'-bisphosphate nucleotidase